MYRAVDGEPWADFIDLNDDEAKLLDFMLGFQYRSEAAKFSQDVGVLEGVDLKTLETGKNGKKIWQRKVPETGVLGMPVCIDGDNIRELISMQ